MSFKYKHRMQALALTLSVTLLCGCSSGGLSSVKKGENILEGLFPQSTSQAQEQEQAQKQAQAQAGTQVTSNELSVPELLKAVLTIKGDLEYSIDALEEQNVDGVDERLDALAGKTDTVRRSLDAAITSLGGSMPSVEGQLESIRDILNLVDMLNEELLQPAAEMMRKNPLDDLGGKDGFRVEKLEKYLDFIEDRMPAAEKLVNQAKTMDLSMVDSDGDLNGKLATAEKLVALYRENPNAIKDLKKMLGMAGDRSYLLAAQNSAEIRASGGYPGAMGVLRIKDGRIILEDFKKVKDVLSFYTPADAHLTNQEASLFHGGMSAPRDADYCPDFERVGLIWALGYEAMQHEPVDGVISITPVLVQKLLNVMNEKVILFDGLTLDGSNAVRVLQYDLYFKYFGNQYVANRDTIADQVFADAAKKTMDLVFEHMEGKELSGYLDVAGEALDDRTMMVWMKDEAEQKIIQTLDWDGGLNHNPQEPEAGVYVNCTIASKMGTFFAMDTEIGKRTKNEDGSYTYPITVTFRDTMTKEDVQKASSYITGGASGAFTGSAYFFAPAGGTVGNFASERQLYIREENYNDLPLLYLQNFQIGMGQSMTFTYEVTTAPGVDAELKFSKTPTIQDYI